MKELIENIEEWFLTNDILSIQEYDYMKESIIKRCYLCGESEAEVTKLIIEGDRYVCDNCIINR